MNWRFELTRYAWLSAMLKSRLFQPMLILLTLLFFVIAILAGFFGTPAGSHNFGIIFVWIVWWALLIMILVPFFGRLWCIVCPIPGPGEWLQRRSILYKRFPRLMSLRWRWPRRFKNIWLQNFGLGMGTGMPGFGPIFTPDETWLLVDYLWTFVFQPEAPTVGR